MEEYQVIKILEGIYEEYVRDNDKDYMERNTALTEAVKALTEIQYYRSIGTVEECREARERQIPIKPKGIYKTRYIWDSAYCPVCGCGITERWNFCQSCGQAISWESDTP